jgi:hypothetical protein
MTYTAGDTITAWADITLHAPAVMTRRDNIRPGDVVHSSHYGRRVVTDVHTAGTGPDGGTTQLSFEVGQSGIRQERYPANSLIPVYPTATAVLLAEQDRARLAAYRAGR